MKEFFFNPKRLVPAVVALAILLYIFAPFSPYNKARPIYPNEVQLDYDKLYGEAKAARKKGDLDKAQENLQKIVLSKAKYRDAQDLLNDITKENLYRKLKEALARNRIPAAKDYLDLLKKTDPDYKDTKKIAEDIKDGSYDNDGVTGGPDTGSGNPAGDNQGDNKKFIEPTLLPINLLPDKIPGFDLLDRSWQREPSEAFASYRHEDTNKDYWAMIDMVIISVSKFDNEKKAQFKLVLEEDIFNKTPEIIDFNDHQAYFGLYRDKVIVHPGALIWTQGRWFFSVIVVPKPPPHDHQDGKCPDDLDGQKGYVSDGRCDKDVERATILKVAEDVTKKFGY